MGINVLVNRKTYFSIVIFSFCVFFTGCFSVKPGTTKSGKHLFDTFFVGEEGTQYFIKPLTLVNKQNKETVYIDFTFRYKNQVRDSVNVNFSLISAKVFKRIDRFKLSNTENEIVCTSLNLLFNEKDNKLYKSRFSTKFSLEEFHKMFDDNNWEITVFNDGETESFIAENKTKRSISILQEEIFVLF